MSREHIYFVYILCNRSHTLYIGVTNNLRARVAQHRDGQGDFTSRYGITRLVYYERFRYVNKAIRRETVIKGWLRAKKVALIEADNPTWNDLYPTLFSVGGIDADSSLRSE